eukprot:gnl/TRDRNA2_/TRDRNA2_163928_c1_seq6.p1 gnl/TRDRNA2_/TRDRNA2_163928_c1~~gnl/TRDRNA2_/TRDRNA2_163928_c1_seq6.p1  ORF type:complete len:143 (+),score=26.08 gnl/TRDRNA2_/TRDRNA2_163928_c1_seq6:64-429(+)
MPGVTGTPARKRPKPMSSRRGTGSESGAESEACAAENWPARNKKRKEAVKGIKATDMYKAYAAAVPKEQRSSSAPRTPDPDDASIKKRPWEWEVQQWRAGLRAWAAANPEAGGQEADDLSQ